MNGPPFRFEAGRPYGGWRRFLRVSDSGLQAPSTSEEGFDAGQKRADHATVAADAAAASRRRKRTGDRAHAWSGAQHHPGQSRTSAEGRDRLAVADRVER